MLNPTLDANLRAEISAVSKAHPELCAWGWQHTKRLPEGGRDPVYGPGDWALMDSQDWRWQVHTAQQFIATRRIRKTLNKGLSSYGWKHKAERWGKAAGLSPYVSNGAMIMAAHLCGVAVEDYRGNWHNTPNPYLALGGAL